MMENLHQFIEHLEKHQNLVRVSKEVNPRLEINAILDKFARRNGPAVLFEKVAGTELPLLGNLWGSLERLRGALGADDDPDQIAVQSASALLERDPQNFVEVPLEAAPCKKIQYGSQEGVDLGALPELQMWPQDEGGQIATGLVFTEKESSPSSRWGRPGLVKTGPQSIALEWVPGMTNQLLTEEIPAVIVIGGPPAFTLIGHWPHCGPLDAAATVRAITGHPVKMVKCENSQLMVPAEAEIILEGRLKPPGNSPAQKFCGLDGYYRKLKPAAMMEITNLTMKNNPVWQTIVSGVPFTEIHNLIKAEEKFLRPIFQKSLPEIVDINLTSEFGTAATAVVSLSKKRAFQAAEAAEVLRKLRPASRNIMVVDEDINVHDPGNTLWAYSIHFRAEQDVTVTTPASRERKAETLLTIDATTKMFEEGRKREMPDKVLMDEAVLTRVENRWTRYGFSKTQ